MEYDNEFDTGNQYEYDKTKLALEGHLKKVKRWLKDSYDTQEEADHIYRYMSDTVESIVKRQSYSLKWDGTGHPDWHGRLYQYLSKWIKLEHELGVITSKMLSLQDNI